MVDFKFTPSAKAFPGSVILRTIRVERNPAGQFELNGKVLSDKVVTHAAAFGIKQRLANSFASAGTLKNKDGGLEPQSVREANWQAMFDKVLAKMISGDVPEWTSVFTEGASKEEADPVQAEINRIVRAKLVAWAKTKDKTLPKAASDEYKALAEKLMEKQGAAIRATAESIVLERDSIDDLDLDEEEDEVETEE